MGRVRHLETIRSWDRSVVSLVERHAINNPVQGALTDMMIWAMAQIEENLPSDKVQVVGMIHDPLLAYVLADEATYWGALDDRHHEDLPLKILDWVPQLVFTADAEAGPNLASLSKLKLAA